MTERALARILEYAEAGAELRRRFFADHGPLLAGAALRLAVTLAKGNKLLFCGSGGNAANARSLAACFVNRFGMARPPLPALALSVGADADNDFASAPALPRQIQALGNPGDMLIALSASGHNTGLIKAMESARGRALTVLALTGSRGGPMTLLCDMFIAVDDARPPLVQELHIAAGHVLCDLTDYYLFENVAELAPYLDDGAPLPDC